MRLITRLFLPVYEITEFKYDRGTKSVNFVKVESITVMRGLHP